MDNERGWYDDPDPRYQRWDGSEWSEPQVEYLSNPQPDFRPQSRTVVKHAKSKAAWSLLVAAVFALNDVAVLPIGYSSFNDTTWAGMSFVAVPFGTLVAVLLLVLYVRKVHLEWATGLGIMVGLVMACSLPLGLFITTVFHMN